MRITTLLAALALATIALPFLAVPAVAEGILHEDLGAASVDVARDQYGALCAGETTRVGLNGYVVVCAGKGILDPSQARDCVVYIDLGYVGFKRCFL